MIQYCYTIPDQYAGSDNWDYDPQYFHVDEDFNVGNTIRFSKACSGDWYWPGSENENDDGSPIYHCDSEDFREYYCNWRIRYVLNAAVPGPDGYLTVLNCPRCGCTPGQNDVITLDQHYGTSG